MTPSKSAPCKRPYSLGKRLEQSEQRRAKVLAAARIQLESSGFPGLTLDALARESGITRQTVYNLFKNKTGVLESLFDQIALDAGMDRMRAVMQQSDPEAMLTGFVQVFTDFWTKDRVFLRRLRGIAAMDPEFGAALTARNQRRRMAATRIISMLQQRNEVSASDRERATAVLVALTSFEFFDVLAESCGNPKEAAQTIQTIVKKSLDL